MIEYQYIVAPVVGGVIGYITNALAIKMLFRPHKPKYLFGHKLPFTPGIIPKEKGRIAKSIGEAISDNLMNEEVLSKYLLSDDMIGKIQTSIDSFFNTQKNNEETLQQFLCHYISEEELKLAVSSISDEASEQIGKRLSESNLGDKIADIVVQHMTDKLKVDGLDIDMPSLVRKFFDGTIWVALAKLIQKPAKKFIAHNINSILSDNGTDIVGNLISSEADNFMSLPMCTLLEGKEEHFAQFKQSATSFYRTIISDHLPRILKSINIPVIIEERINEMEMEETERLIFDVMDKELSAIVWLGALLGTIMGCVNLYSFT